MKLKKTTKRGCKISRIIPLIISCFFVYTFTVLNFLYSTHSKIKFRLKTKPLLDNVEIINLQRPDVMKRPEACSSEQRAKILKQLTPTRCDKRPHHQRCSLTQATKCPDQNWLNSYYKELKKKPSDPSPFVAIYVGCNKGYDAVNAIRMGTRNSKYNKSDWHSKVKEIHGSVCDQNETPEFPLSGSETIHEGIVHCIEPMPIMAARLKSSVSDLGWEESFIVAEAAVSNRVGEVSFLVNERIGVENIGIANCEKVPAREFEKHCKKVPLVTLDHYVNNMAKKKVEGFIDILSIDVEGYDFDVMLGGKQTLSKTKYLEFEYNWMGSWEKQDLIDAVKMLESLYFTCYWAGNRRLWRIDESCWLEHYAFHTWSNVACVNRHLLPEVAKNMEEIFQKTLEEKKVKY